MRATRRYPDSSDGEARRMNHHTSSFFEPSPGDVHVNIGNSGSGVWLDIGAVHFGLYEGTTADQLGQVIAIANEIMCQAVDLLNAETSD